MKALIRLLSAASERVRRRPVPPDPETVRRIVVLQMTGIGDLLLITPALRALRQLYPKARLDLITYKLEHASFLFRLPNMGQGCEFALFDLRLARAWTRSFWRKLWVPIRFLRKEPCDVYVSFHHTWLPQWYLLELWVALFSGARYRVGVNPGSVTGPGVFDRAISESSLGARHYRSFFLDVCGLLGDSGKQLVMEFPLSSSEIQEAKDRLRRVFSERVRIVCLHVGASYPSKRWPLDRFVQLADRLQAARYGIVLVGTWEERALTRQLVGALPEGSVLDTAGSTTLFQMAALIHESQLFIGNDSGPLHVAVALKRPAIGLIGPSQPRYYRYEPEEAVILRDGAMSPTPDVIARKDAVWNWTLSVDQVYEQALRLLA